MTDSLENKKKHRKKPGSFVTKSLNELDKKSYRSAEIEVAWEFVKRKFDELGTINVEVKRPPKSSCCQKLEQSEAYLKRFTTLRLKSGEAVRTGRGK
ncbi:hypothetical protein NQ317_004870 [Molorchus minor]|uniref:Uncharacterized protein n=1 Tax=Molorchus minor TaxID=1323400 RepID=A0ABQ9IQT3_9CUCU|nr:hypothetical protein NQ317_004870 [Molorchus minor]